MTVLIISSSIDPASNNIKKTLLNQSNWDEIDTFNENKVYRNSIMKDLIIVTINDRKIFHENIDKEVEQKLGIKPKQAIFISRHTSETGLPTLTTHPIGNYKNADFGGKENTLCKSSPRLMSELLRILNKNAKDANTYHKICFEVTHHGPYLEIPTLFIEVGSNETEWKKQQPAEIVSKSVLDLLNLYHYEEDLPKDIPVLIGLGGGHYAPRYTDVVLEKKCAFGHMIPNYHIDHGIINEEIIEMALENTPDVSGVYLHRKALKKAQIREYRQWFEEKGIPVISSKELQNLKS